MSLLISAEAECSICLTPYGDSARNGPHILSCGHAFCKSCLNRVLSDSSTCPKCRKHFRRYWRVYVDIASNQQSANTSHGTPGHTTRPGRHRLVNAIHPLVSLHRRFSRSRRQRTGSSEPHAAEYSTHAMASYESVSDVNDEIGSPVGDFYASAIAAAHYSEPDLLSPPLLDLPAMHFARPHHMRHNDRQGDVPHIAEGTSYVPARSPARMPNEHPRYQPAAGLIYYDQVQGILYTDLLTATASRRPRRLDGYLQAAADDYFYYH